MTADSPLAEWIASPNFGMRRPQGEEMPPCVDVLVLHSTCMTTNDIEECIHWFQTTQSEVSSHYIVGKDGRIVQMVSEEMRAWHAGKCDWQGRSDINSCSIGIELVHRDQDASDTWPDKQMMALAQLLADLRTRFVIPDTHVIFHSECAIPPGRKTDPRDFDRTRLLKLANGLLPSSLA